MSAFTISEISTVTMETPKMSKFSIFLQNLFNLRKLLTCEDVLFDGGIFKIAAVILVMRTRDAIRYC